MENLNGMFGVIPYRSLSVSDLAQVDYPTISVNASLPGANADTMAFSVATVSGPVFSSHAKQRLNV